MVTITPRFGPLGINHGTTPPTINQNIVHTAIDMAKVDSAIFPRIFYVQIVVFKTLRQLRT
uniref:Uncharacterized protein n=1 Tax=Anguilla anguilla TaxID=7936 RepID=A0A0E9XIC1_ANGAN